MNVHSATEKEIESVTDHRFVAFFFVLFGKMRVSFVVGSRDRVE